MSLRLRLLNLARWFREHLFVWSFLSTIYSITLALLLQPILEMGFKLEIPLQPLWAATCLVIVIPALLERVPGQVPRFFSLVLASWIPSRTESNAFRSLYLRHELRRLPTWLGVLAVGVSLCWIPADRAALWLLIAQLPLQRSLFSIHRWRALALAHHPRLGAGRLLMALISSQLIQWLLSWLFAGFLAWMFAGPTFSLWLRLGAAGVAGVLAGGCVAMEGDSGRPWIVNFISLAAGAVGALLTLVWPVSLLVVAYLAISMSNSVAERLRSVEHQDEDTVIS